MLWGGQGSSPPLRATYLLLRQVLTTQFILQLGPNRLTRDGFEIDFVEDVVDVAGVLSFLLGRH